MRSMLTWSLGVALAAMLGCSDNNSPSNGGGGGGGGNPGTVTIGNIFFQSGNNGTQNPAIDTVAVGTTVTWTMTNTGSTSHTVRSEESPSFASSDTLSGNGTTYTVTFTAPGTYQYDCAIHGDLMTGRIVVQ
jgi:plastocyanin